jgi:hypothetical protein
VTVTSRLPVLIDYLTALFTNAATLGQATPPVTVYDGPPTTAFDAALSLYVGLDDALSDQPPTAATSEQSLSGGLDPGKRQELVTIYCAAVVWFGTDDMRTVRTAAFQILAAAEDLVRTDAAHFGGNADLADPGVSGIALTQNNTQQGAVAQAAFTITFRSFIGT